MKKTLLLSLLVFPLFFLSACSLPSNKMNNLKKEEQKPSLESLEVVYKNEDYRFQITFPETWKNFIVKNETGSLSFSGQEKFPSKRISFGFPVKSVVREGEILSEECPTCFENIFSLDVMTRQESDSLEKARLADIEKNGANPSNSGYRIISSNLDYVFYGPPNFHGQSYDGEFIENRAEEADKAVSGEFVTWD